MQIACKSHRPTNKELSYCWEAARLFVSLNDLAIRTWLKITENCTNRKLGYATVSYSHSVVTMAIPFRHNTRTRRTRTVWWHRLRLRKHRAAKKWRKNLNYVWASEEAFGQRKHPAPAIRSRSNCHWSSGTQRSTPVNPLMGTLKPYSKQQTIIQQYDDWYTGRWWVGCYIWYSKEWPRHLLLLVPLLRLQLYRCVQLISVLFGIFVN